MNNNIWEILQLQPQATKKEIRRQYAKLSRNCHPEEEPEEFARLQNAYQEALKLCESSKDLFQVDMELVDEKQSENKMFQEKLLYEKTYDKESCNDFHNQEKEAYDEPVTPLMDKLLKKEESDFEKYISSGIIKTILDTLADSKKKNKPVTWQEIFLSDEFLDEQFTEQFAKGLQYVFEQIPQVTNVNEVPSAFLTDVVVY